MGREWRAFKSITEQEYNEHIDSVNSVEERTDVYIVFPDEPELGLKLRNESEIELKIRTKRGTKGVEKWKKPISTLLQSGNTIFSTSYTLNTTAIEEIESILRKNQLKHQLIQKCLTLFCTGNYVLIRMKKRRVQRYHMTYTSENTWIKWSYQSNTDGQEYTGYSQSVCCEGRRSGLFKRIEAFIKQNAKGLTSQGYPQFGLSIIH
jgi:RNase P subunit RPR2